MNITRPSEDITRIIIPFLDIDTAVFLVRLGEEYLLFDTATYDTDMTEPLPTLGWPVVAAARRELL